MPDSRIAYKSGIPGFEPGQMRLNQTKQVFFQATYNWKVHATIEVFDKTGQGLNETRKISHFHVSLYCTDDNQRWGGFYWEFDSRSDSFVFKGWENYLKNNRKDILGVSDKDYDLILKKATTVATNLKTTFGSTGIEAPKWGDEQQAKLVVKVTPVLTPPPSPPVLAPAPSPPALAPAPFSQPTALTPAPAPLPPALSPKNASTPPAPPWASVKRRRRKRR